VRLFGLLILTSTTAWAAPPRFALEPLRFTGNATAEERKLLADRVFDTIELLSGNHGIELVHREDLIADLAEHPDLKECAEPRCRKRLGDVARAERVVSIQVDRSGPRGRGEWNVKIEQFAVAAAHALPFAEVPCRSCTVDELVGDLSHALDPLLAAPTPLSVCRLTVATEPSGAAVKVDGTLLGETPFLHTVQAGRRTVAVERAGSPPATSTVECPAGGSELVSLDLAPTVARAAIRPPERSPALRSRLLVGLGAALVAVGAAGLVAGAVNLSLDGTGSCDKSSGQTECKKLYDTRTLGAAFTALGAAALVGGEVLLVLDAVRRTPRLGAALRLGPGSAIVGVRVDL
jgi:hypothetical protein